MSRSGIDYYTTMVKQILTFINPLLRYDINRPTSRLNVFNQEILVPNKQHINFGIANFFHFLKSQTPKLTILQITLYYLPV